MNENQTIERNYEPFSKKGFTLTIEQLPGVDVNLLHVKKGKVETSIAITEIETELFINFFKFTVMPPIFETF